MSDSTQTTEANAEAGQRQPTAFLAALPHLFGLALLLLLALSVLTRILPQLPGHITGRPEAQAWLLRTSRLYPLGTWLAALGLFAITRTIFFRALLLSIGVLATVQVGYACYLLLWPRRGEAAVPLSPQAAESGHVRHEAQPFSATAQRIRTHLLAYGLVAEARPQGGELRLFARRGAYGALGSALFFLGTFLVMTGIYWGLTLGWQTSPVILAPGQSWDVGHETGLRVDLRSAGGKSAGELTSILFVQRQDKSPSVVAIRLGRKVRVDDVYLVHTAIPLGVALRATDPAGTAIPLQTPTGRAGREITLLFPAAGTERLVLIPSHNMEVRIVGYPALPERGYTGPVFLIQITTQGRDTPLYSEFITGDRDIHLQRLTLTVRVVYHAQIYAAYYPGRGARVLGTFLLLLGAALALVGGPLRRLWVQVFGDEAGTVVRVWGDVYNLGWHRPLPGELAQEWLTEDRYGDTA